MIFYSFEDIMDAYEISKATLKKKVKSGELIAQKLFMSIDGNYLFRWIIPQTELEKLSKLKKKEPLINPMSQPSYYTGLKKIYDNNKKEWELYRAEKGSGYGMSEEKLNSENNFYLQYLKTPRYRELHRKTLQRDKYKCQICGTGTNLVVHHVTYRRLGNEGLDDLVTLCDSCHFEVHKKDLEKKKQSLFESFIKEANNGN